MVGLNNDLISIHTAIHAWLKISFILSQCHLFGKFVNLKAKYQIKLLLCVNDILRDLFTSIIEVFLLIKQSKNNIEIYVILIYIVI